MFPTNPGAFCIETKGIIVSTDVFTGEFNTDICLIESVCFVGGVVMVWLGIMCGYRPLLVFIDGSLTAQSYVSIVYRPVVAC